jgi:hypothetical protein
MFEMFNTETAYGLICLSPLHDKLKVKFPRFLEFSKGVSTEYLEDDEDGYDDLLDRKVGYYESLYENGEISKEEFEAYVLEEEKKRSEAHRKEKLKIIPKKDGYTLFLKRSLVSVDAVLNTVAKTYFCENNDEIWNKTEPIFYAILERNLGMNEDNLHVYAELLSYIYTDPVYASERIIVDKLKKLDEFKDIKDIRDVIKDVPTDNKEAFSKSLIRFLMEHAEKAWESKGEEFIRSREILKAILSLT